MNTLKEKRLFEDAPILEAVAKLAVPTVIGQIILVIYNIADTFFIGLTGSDAEVTAITICTPMFMFISAVSNLFGIGGCSAISRALGKNDEIKAKNISSFAFWGCIFTTVIYSAVSYKFIDKFINLLGGTNTEVHYYAYIYIIITVVIGGFATSVSALLSHLIRSEGHGFPASFGIALGGILNIILDPVFMFVILKPGQEVMGAALATAISNIISIIFFICFMLKNRFNSVLSFAPKYFCMDKGIAKDVFVAGFPAFVMTVCENFSYGVLDKLLSQYGIKVQAGIGVAKKVNMLAHSIVRGMAQGMLPLISYNYAKRNMKRMKKALITSTAFSVFCAVICAVSCFIFKNQLMEMFLQNSSDSVDFGAKFLCILCIGSPFSACAYSCISFFQALGYGKKSFILAIMRKGLFDIPLMFILNRIYPIFGAVLATPIADIICCIAAIISVYPFLKECSTQKSGKICNTTLEVV